VAGEGQVGTHGWAYRRRQPEGTVLYEAVPLKSTTALPLRLRACTSTGAPHGEARLQRRAA
jgi:hypothetical protein